MINDNENDIYNYTAPDSPSIDNSFNANTLPSSPDVADSAPNVCQSESFNQPQSNSAWQAPQANFEQPPTPPRMTQVNIRCPQCGTFCSTDFCTECGCDMRANFGAALRNEPPTSSVNGYTVASQYTNPYAYNQAQIGYNQAQIGYNYAQVKSHKLRNVIIAISSVIVFAGLFLGILSVSNRVIPPVQRPSAGTDDVPKYNNDIFGYNKPTEQPVSRDTVPNGISQDEFDRIAVGMTYAQISGIIGGDGVLTDSGQNIHKVSYDTYSWIVENDLSLAVHVTFIEGKAYEIVADSSME